MVESLVEFFSLRGAAARGEGVDPAVRAQGLGHLRLGRQRDAAARDLWLSGHRAEGLRLALEGLAETARGAALVGLPRDEADGLLGDATPALDADVAPAHADRYRRVRRVRARLDAALAPSLDTPRERSARRALRRAAALAPALAAVAAILVAASRPAPPRATASDFHPEPPGFGPEKVIDGDAYTEWLLPTFTTGWIDIAFARPRALAAVRLLNAHNRGANDMATQRYRIEAFAGARPVGTFTGAFPTLDPEPAWYRAPLPAAGVTRVRVTVESFHRAGGGLAEIDFE